MGIATWTYRFLQIFNRRGNRHRQNSRPSEVKSFKVQQEKEAAFDTRDRGIQSIPLDRIVGSVGRYKDFDNQFRFKQKISSERLQRIREAIFQRLRSWATTKFWHRLSNLYLLKIHWMAFFTVNAQNLQISRSCRLKLR